MSQPIRLVVKYEDGSTREVDFASVDGELQLKLAQLGLCPPLDHVGQSKHYLLVRWQDGWQEVFGLDSASAELIRYYVIQRIEDRGRLSVDVGEDYPELLVLERTPTEVEGAMIVSDENVRSYALDTQVERWEGIFEAGGKKEFVKYDRTSDAYPQERSEDPAALAELLAALDAQMVKRGLTSRTLLTMPEPQRTAQYKELANSTGLRGGRKQADVYGFVEMLLRRREGA
jgi:hypothetical protein